MPLTQKRIDKEGLLSRTSKYTEIEESGIGVAALFDELWYLDQACMSLDDALDDAGLEEAPSIGYVSKKDKIAKLQEDIKTLASFPQLYITEYEAIDSKFSEDVTKNALERLREIKASDVNLSGDECLSDEQMDKFRCTVNVLSIYLPPRENQYEENKESVLFLLDKAKNKTLNTSERGALENFKKWSDEIEDEEKKKEFKELIERAEIADYWSNKENFPNLWYYDEDKYQKALTMLERETELEGKFCVLNTDPTNNRAYQHKMELIQRSVYASETGVYDDGTLNGLQAIGLSDFDTTIGKEEIDLLRQKHKPREVTSINYFANPNLIKTNENIDEYEGLTKEQKKKKKEFDDYWYNDENFPPEWQYDPVKTKKAFDMMQKEIEEFGPFELLLTGEHTTKQWEIYQRKINLIQDAACAPMSTRYDENTLNALQATYSLENREFNLEEGITLESLEMLKERKANRKFEKAGQIAGRYHIGEGLQAVAFVGMLTGLAERNYQPDNSKLEKIKSSNDTESAKTIPQKLTQEGKTPAIGKMRDLNLEGSVSEGEFKVADYLPNKGSPKANWKQNSGVLRSVMNEKVPIKDVSPYPMENAGFLGAERNLLQSRGWSYSNGYWYPPTY